MSKDLNNFIQSNSPDGGFLQSEHWRKFQESVGRKTFSLSEENDEELIASANVIEHTLPIVGKYFYIPRGPIIDKPKIQKFLDNVINLAEEENLGWIRIEPVNKGILDLIEESLSEKYKIKKSAVDMQPKEILVLDISKSEEYLLAGMKQKTRYNIKLAEKKDIKVIVSRDNKCIEEFLRLVRVTAERDKITSHPENYYRKMFEAIPPEILKLYVAEYEGKTIAANLVLFFGKTATYMHGASDNEHRNLMAPYLLQWQAIRDVKKAGGEKYDFGGVNANKWPGITKFKTGFAPETKLTQFPGSYDIILKPGRYNLYRGLQKIKKFF